MGIYLYGCLFALVLFIGGSYLEYRTANKIKITLGDLFMYIFIIMLSWVGFAFLLSCFISYVSEHHKDVTIFYKEKKV